MHRAALLALLALAGLAIEGRPNPDTATRGASFNFKARKADDRVKVSQTREGVVLRVTCPSGIGDLEVSLKEGDWPERLTLQLEVGMLEWFAVTNGRLTLSGNLREAGEQGVLGFDERGQRVEDRAKAVHTLRMKADGKQRLIEIVLPAGFCAKDTKALKFDWIDAFRG
ncbi:MAG: hypothetical protein JNM56_31340 [Planctomycetia bacterium]|nr:hypothetical protein [Planctomycetia bacterium]